MSLAEMQRSWHITAVPTSTPPLATDDVIGGHDGEHHARRGRPDAIGQWTGSLWRCVLGIVSDLVILGPSRPTNQASGALDV
jgi:hypothetical protein